MRIPLAPVKNYPAKSWQTKIKLYSTMQCHNNEQTWQTPGFPTTFGKVKTHFQLLTTQEWDFYVILMFSKMFECCITNTLGLRQWNRPFSFPSRQLFFWSMAKIHWRVFLTPDCHGHRSSFWFIRIIQTSVTFLVPSAFPTLPLSHDCSNKQMENTICQQKGCLFQITGLAESGHLVGITGVK